MPKLKTMRFGYYTKSKKDLTMFDVEISVSQDGRFYCRADTIPEPIRRAFKSEFDTEKFDSDTLRGLARQIDEYIERHRELIMEQRSEKIILYRILIQGDLTPDLGGQDNGSRRHNDFHDDCDLGIGLTWEVVIKTRILGRTEYTTLKGYQFGDNYKRKEIPWTEAREIWFKNFEETLRKLALRVDTFFDEMTPENLTQFIDTGKTLLPPSDKKGD